MKKYQGDRKGYLKKVDELLAQGAEGKKVVYVKFENNGIALYYKDKKDKSATATKTDAEMVDYLKGKKLRNDQIKQEKTLEEVKKALTDAEIPTTAWVEDEESMFYSILMGFLRRQHQKTVGIEPPKYGYSKIDEDNRGKIAPKLTDEQKAVIRREFIYSCIKESTSRDVKHNKLLQFIIHHLPEKYAEVKAPHDETYKKMNQRLDERIGSHQYRIEMPEAGIKDEGKKAKTDKTAKDKDAHKPKTKKKRKSNEGQTSIQVQ